MIQVSANLYRIAAACQSREETRYYLNGVLIEPHATQGGVLLVATDGHRLICIHDETGRADKPAIIALSPDAFKACKGDRVLVVDDGEATVFEKGDRDELGDKVAVSPHCVVDGTFPDYRHVIPQKLTDNVAPAFAGSNLASLATIGGDLALHFLGWKAPKPGRANSDQSSRCDALRLLAEDCEAPFSSPVVVMWQCIPQAFAVLMPVRIEGGEARLPSWYLAPQAAPTAQNAA